jgi:hypothetical protein
VYVGIASPITIPAVNLCYNKQVPLLCLRLSFECPLNAMTFNVTVVSQCHIVKVISRPSADRFAVDRRQKYSSLGHKLSPFFSSFFTYVSLTSILSFETINKLKLSFECGIPRPQDAGHQIQDRSPTSKSQQTTCYCNFLSNYIYSAIAVLATCPRTQGYRKEPLFHTKRRPGRYRESNPGHLLDRQRL